LAIWVEVSDLKCRGLSNSCQCQGKLFGSGDQGWSTHGIVNPLGQFAVGKQVQPQHRGQIGQRPVGLGEVVQPFQQEQGDQGCPNLNAEGVFAGADKALYGQILLQRLEKQLSGKGLARC
jgi:hypothetical protein